MKKIIPAIIIFSLIFSVLLNGLPQRAAAAEQSFGATIGKAAGAAVACWTASYIGEMLSKEVIAKIDGYVTTLTDATNYAAAALSVPVFDASAIVTANNNESKNQSSQAMVKSKDCARDVLAKIIIDWLVDQIVIWIQGGGEPKFVTNWESFVSDAFQAGVGTVINESNFRFLCSPFRAQVRLSLLPVKKFPQRIQCTLDQVVDNIEDFYNDFSKGGWIAYNEMWQPQNNYYGQILLFYDEAMMKGLAAKEAAQDEAMAGRGFLSVKRCVEYDNDKLSGIIEDARKSGMSDQEIADMVSETQASKTYNDTFCKKWQTNTPGFVVGEAAAEAMTSDIKWAYNIKSWVAAIINATLNRLLTEGLAYMKGSQEEYDTKTGDYAPVSASSTIKYGGADFTGLDESSTENVVAIYEKFLADSKAILASKQSSLSSVDSLISVLNDMKNKGCSGFSQTDLDAANTAKSTLASDISKLQDLINEIQSNLDEARAAVAAEDNEVRLAVLKKYNEFTNEKYQKILMGEYAGSTKSGAQTEAAKWQAKLNDAQSKLNQCQTTATSTIITGTTGD